MPINGGAGRRMLEIKQLTGCRAELSLRPQSTGRAQRRRSLGSTRTLRLLRPGRQWKAHCLPASRNDSRTAKTARRPPPLPIPNSLRWDRRAPARHSGSHAQQRELRNRRYVVSDISRCWTLAAWRVVDHPVSGLMHAADARLQRAELLRASWCSAVPGSMLCVRGKLARTRSGPRRRS